MFLIPGYIRRATSHQMASGEGAPEYDALLYFLVQRELSDPSVGYYRRSGRARPSREKGDTPPVRLTARARPFLFLLSSGGLRTLLSLRPFRLSRETGGTGEPGPANSPLVPRAVDSPLRERTDGDNRRRDKCVPFNEKRPSDRGGPWF